MRFEILGPLGVYDDLGPLQVSGTKRRALLIALLAHANEVVVIDQLMEWLWTHEPPRSAPLVIQAHISVLRRQLEPDRARGVRPGLLFTHANGYLLRVTPQQLDMLRFEELVRAANQSLPAGAVEQAAELLDDALALWRGDPLSDVRYLRVAQSEIARLEELRLTATALRMEVGLRLGRYLEIIPQLSSLIVVHPYHERFYAQLMRALVGCGRRAEALTVYRRVYQTLLDELAVEPGPELRRLLAGILADDSDD